MKYQSGEDIQVGDFVLIEFGKTEGVVKTIIDSIEMAREFNLEETGLLLESEPFGLVFWPMTETEDPVVFLSRRQN
jgi:hypothetical protein